MNQEFLRLPAVLKRYGIGRTTVYDLMAKSKFPKPIHVGRSSLWSIDELDQFDQAKLHEREQHTRRRFDQRGLAGAARYFASKVAKW